MIWLKGEKKCEDPQPNPGGNVAGSGVDDTVRYEWMEKNIAAPLRVQTNTSSYDGLTDSTSFDKTSASPASSIGSNKFLKDKLASVIRKRKFAC